VFGGVNGLFALGDDIRLSEDYRNRIHKIWDEVRPDPSWHLEIFLGEPGPILTQHAADADLLVVGTHFHVGLGRVFPGSVSHYCLTHSQVPVIAVPAKAEPARPMSVDATASADVSRAAKPAEPVH
jgi:hypothetical protein